MGVLYKKTCKNCKKEFTSAARGQRYCCPECGIKYRTRLKDDRTTYSKSKDVERIRSRSHSLAVRIMDELVSLGVVTKQCAHCGSTKNLQVHHIDKFNWLNNTPSNLVYLCEACHNKEHSRIAKELEESGKTLEDYHESSMEPFYKILDNARR